MLQLICHFSVDEREYLGVCLEGKVFIHSLLHSILAYGYSHNLSNVNIHELKIGNSNVETEAVADNASTSFTHLFLLRGIYNADTLTHMQFLGHKGSCFVILPCDYSKWIVPVFIPVYAHDT